MRIRIIKPFLCLLALASAPAQEPQAAPAPQEKKNDLLEAPLFPTRDWFRTRFETPSTQVTLQPIARLSDFVADGKLELSLASYLELVMLNNTGILVQRLQIEIPRHAITRSFARFDPTFGLTFRGQRSDSPVTSELQGGTESVSTLIHPLSMDYTQTLSTGTNLTVAFDGTRTSTDNRFATYNPSYVSALSFDFSQPLLRDRGAINKVPIMVARSRFRQTEYTLRDQVILLVSQAENTYWNVIQARENLDLQNKFLELRGEALKRAQRELELGALSPLDIYQPQADYASAEVAVIQARYQLSQAEDALRRQIGADLAPDIRTLPIVLTETVLPPADAALLDKEESVAKALKLRPDLLAVNQSLDIDDLNIRLATNSLRPDLALTGGFSGQGRGGIFEQPGGAIIPGGPGDALSKLFSFAFPTYAVGLRLSFPIRDRRATADLADATVQKKLDSLRLRATEQAVRLEVNNAVDQVESSKASVKQATIARDFAQKRLEAEQKKYELGTTVLFFVLDAQTALNQRENEVLRQSINYRRNLVSYLVATGELLDVRGITIQ